MWQAEICDTDFLPMNDGRDYLPAMTALFIDGLSTKSENIDERAKCNPHTDEQKQGDHLPSVSLPLHYQMSLPEIKRICMRIEKPGCERRIVPQESTLKALRFFICGVSSCFNNILMGIGGNVSLISMMTDPRQPLYAQVAHMDRLIQNGALLIHSLFGYLAERRLEAKHLRLVQLIQEIHERIQDTKINIDIQKIERGMELASQINRPTVVAEGMARVLDQLLQWLDEQMQAAMKASPKNLLVRQKLNTISKLIQRGFSVVRQLELYAGSTTPTRQRMGINALMKGPIEHARKAFPHIEIDLDKGNRLYSVCADKSQMQFVLRQLICSTAQTVPNGGTIKVSVCATEEETPEEKCEVAQACDHLVITVSGNGMGMRAHLQSNLLTPFYRDSHLPKGGGLGLAAADKVIQRHGGSIQVKSSHETGNIFFEIYLPGSDMIAAGCGAGQCTGFGAASH